VVILTLPRPARRIWYRMWRVQHVPAVTST